MSPVVSSRELPSRDLPSRTPPRPVRRSAALSPAALLRRRFRRDQEGATAVEFALVAIPFFGLMFAIIETSFTMLAGQLVDTAVIDASRLVMTGQAETQKFDAAKFKATVCANVPSFIDCKGKVYTDVKVLSGYGASPAIPTDKAGNFDPSKVGYQASTAEDIVMVRAYYRWSGIIASVARKFGLDFSNQPDGSTLIVATSVFRNEPYK
ncbi:TadE/TadG family type IV pilus assembly protein [Ancylobacter terrae]|uniref:TadE/TadG family type IV pilus assembly protein n=1 Tax=Ancylobacter sp. sgz301288 TaxID=3342077 RepID=UPI00385DAA64